MKPIPIGLCQCGCGRSTPIAEHTNSRKGWIIGKPTRFARGHKLPRPLTERLAKHINKTEGCWLWTGWKNNKGYGMLTERGKHVLAHRMMWESINGPIPSGMELDHLCRNTLCVRPDHLEAVTHRENILRGAGPIPRNARKTHCPHGHVYDRKNTRLNNGHRACRACGRIRARERSR